MLACQPIARTDQRGVARRPATAGCMEQRRASGQRFACERLETLRHVQFAILERLQLLAHGEPGDKPRRSQQRVHVASRIAQIGLQAIPGRWHFRDDTEAKAGQCAEIETRRVGRADQEKRVARYHLAEAHQRGAVGRRGVVVLDHPHRPAPGEVDRAALDVVDRAPGRTGRQPVKFHALTFGQAQRLHGIEGCVKHRAEVFRQGEFHHLRKYCWRIRISSP